MNISVDANEMLVYVDVRDGSMIAIVLVID